MKKTKPTIKFERPEKDNQDRLFITIETERLLIKTVTPEDAENYQALFEDKKVMAKYATGKPKADNPDYAKNRIAGWYERWGKNDPYNGMAVFLKDSGEFVGHVVIGRSGFDGISELAYLFHSKFWNKGLESEAVVAVVNHLAPNLVQKDYLLDDHKLTQIIATTRFDHIPSQKILSKVGMKPDAEINEKFGAQRFIYRVDIEKLLQNKVEGIMKEIVDMSDKEILEKFGATETQTSLVEKNVFDYMRKANEVFSEGSDYYLKN